MARQPKSKPRNLSLPIDKVAGYRAREVLYFPDVKFNGRIWHVWMMPKHQLEKIDLEITDDD